MPESLFIDKGKTINTTLLCPEGRRYLKKRRNEVLGYKRSFFFAHLLPNLVEFKELRVLGADMNGLNSADEAVKVKLSDLEVLKKLMECEMHYQTDCKQVRSLGESLRYPKTSLLIFSGLAVAVVALVLALPASFPFLMLAGVIGLVITGLCAIIEHRTVKTRLAESEQILDKIKIQIGSCETQLNAVNDEEVLQHGTFLRN